VRGIPFDAVPHAKTAPLALQSNLFFMSHGFVSLALLLPLGYFEFSYFTIALPCLRRTASPR
jgi:hypothetical protein